MSVAVKGRSEFASPFQRLATLIRDVAPGQQPIDLSIGEPRHPVPPFVAPVLAGEIARFSSYPPIRGSEAFRAAVAAWLQRRYRLSTPIDVADGVLPLNGSREGLFSAALQAASMRQGGEGRPAVLIPNPFYPVYAAGASAAGAEPVMVPARAETGFLPDIEALPQEVLARTVACYFASPANPQGAVASLDQWQRLIGLARRHGFWLFADECYSEIWRGAAPVGALEAADGTGSYAGVIAFNSLSKRSNLAGLRCGFAAGDPAFITAWARQRNVYAPQVPLPVQAVAVAALADEAHVAENRRLYDEKFADAETILAGRFDHLTPRGGFFLWLDVAAHGGGEAVALRLWRRAGVKVVPGRYLAADEADGGNPGKDYIRIAMVEARERTAEALTRLVAVLEDPS